MRSASANYLNSDQITNPLVKAIEKQEKSFSHTIGAEQTATKRRIKSENRKSQEEHAKRVREEMSAKLQRAMDMASEKGASCWVVALPISEHNFTLHKGSFKDALCLRYGWKLSRLPSHYICGVNFSVEHSFSCPCDALSYIRHND